MSEKLSQSARNKSTIPLSEADFLRQVTDLAAILGWEYVHFRPAQTQRGWRTPVQGSLGKGWPDLFMVRGGRKLAAELKREGAKTTPEQDDCLQKLQRAGLTVFVWHPSDFDRICEVLR